MLEQSAQVVKYEHLYRRLEMLETLEGVSDPAKRENA
jgi:hypothetical protein